MFARCSNSTIIKFASFALGVPTWLLVALPVKGIEAFWVHETWWIVFCSFCGLCLSAVELLAMDFAIKAIYRTPRISEKILLGCMVLGCGMILIYLPYTIAYCYSHQIKFAQF